MIKKVNVISLALLICVAGADAAEDGQLNLDELLATGKQEITVPPGRYRHAKGIVLSGLTNVTVNATGVELVCTSYANALVVTNCSGLTVRGLGIDYDPLPWTQGVVCSVDDKAGTAEVELASGYPADDVLTFKNQYFDGKTRELLDVSGAGSFERMAPRRLRAHWSKGAKLPPVGSLFVSNVAHPVMSVFQKGPDDYSRRLHAVVQVDSSQTRFEDVTVWASPWFSFFERDCDGTVYLRCRVDRRPPEDDPVRRGMLRLRASDSDAFHCVRAARGPKILECTARYMEDDGVNVHGFYHLIASSKGKELRVLAQGGMNISPGDTVELCDASGRLLPDAKVVSVRADEPAEVTPGERVLLKNRNMRPYFREHWQPKAFRVTLNRSEALAFGSVIVSLAHAGGGFAVSDSVIGHTRARGVLVRARDGLVSGNDISDTGLQAVLLTSEPWWLEGGTPLGTRVENNRVSRCKADPPVKTVIADAAKADKAKQTGPGEIMFREHDKMLADPWRPKYHFVIDGNGMPGDPNGAFYHDGKYHLMFLYKRETGFCWGHCISYDAVRWYQVQDAIGPEPGQEDGCWSGGAFVDDDGTAYLTYWMPWGKNPGIRIAKSTNAELTAFKANAKKSVIRSNYWGWTREILPDGTKRTYGSADPSNIWKKDGKYYMLGGNYCLLNDLGRKPDSPEQFRGDCAYLFESENLETWKYVGPFYQRRIHETRASGWTDPDEDSMCSSFFPLPRSAEGGAPSDKHLLLFLSHNRGCHYYIGTYGEDNRFVPESHGRMSWNDRSFFAPEALVDDKGRQIMWVWLADNKNGDLERYGWTGAYGLPRCVWLAKDGTLGMAPIEELKILRTKPRSWESVSLASGESQVLDGFPGDCCELELEVPYESAANLRLEVRGSADWSQHTAITYDREAAMLKFCGAKSGIDNYRIKPHFPNEDAPFKLSKDEKLRLRVFVDKAVIEVFANDRQAITRRVYPDATSNGIRVMAVGGGVSASVKAWEMMPTNFR